MALSLPPPGGRTARVRQEAAAAAVLAALGAWREGACPHLAIVAGPAELVFLYLSFDVTGLFDPFHSRATQSWVWVVLKKTKGGKTAW